MIEDYGELEKPYFEAKVLDSIDHPAGFMTWSEGITYDKYRINLPNNTSLEARMFMDHQQFFNNGSYTTFLVHRFNEL